MSLNAWGSPNVWDSGSVISITESTSGYELSAINPTILLSSGLLITENVVSIEYSTQNPTIVLSSPKAITSTVCFNGELSTLEFDGSLAELNFNGIIKTNC